MGRLEEAIAEIRLPDTMIAAAARQRLDDQVKPKGSLGRLEEMGERLAGIFGKIDVNLHNKVIVTCAGDHGVADEGVSLFPREITIQMVNTFVNGGASINVLAAHAGARVMVADLGVDHDFDPGFPIFHKKIGKGTDNLRRMPAMSREDAVASVEAGIEIVDTICASGPLDMLGTGDMGIANTTPSTAIIAAYSGIAVEKLTGRGTGLDDAGLENKIRVVEDALALHNPNPADPMDVLSKVGGFEIGGLAGLVIGAAAHGIPVVCDGLIATAGALIACELAPSAKEYLFASHRSEEIGHQFMLEHLGLTPLLDFGLRLGEGTGAALAMEILDASTRVLADIKTFAEAGLA